MNATVAVTDSAQENLKVTLRKRSEGHIQNSFIKKFYLLMNQLMEQFPHKIVGAVLKSNSQKLVIPFGRKA